MRLKKRKPSGREKDEASVRLLEKLREQLYSSNVSLVRQSAFNLSWMQEDGLDILKEALFSEAPRRTKGAAAYGLRKMRGRMKKMAEEVLSEGLKHSDRTTLEVSGNALLVLKKSKTPERQPATHKTRGRRIEIREIPGRGKRRVQKHRPGRSGSHFSKRH